VGGYQNNSLSHKKDKIGEHKKVSVMSNDDTTILNLNHEEIDKPRFGYGNEKMGFKIYEDLLVKNFKINLMNWDKWND